MNREALILKLKQQVEPWDIIVIGGGATGLGIAVDAVSRGYKTLLLDQADFAGGTSSRSTKLVHGGVRYLAQGDIFLVVEALYERGRMLQNAPHLTANQEFVIPVYTRWDIFLYAVGLFCYDVLSGNLSLGKSRFINRNKILERLPQLLPDGLRGGVVYHDGQFDDSRMAVSLAHTSVEKGAVVLNYFRVSGLLKDDQGKVTGVRASDIESGMEYNLTSKVVINATGVFADEIHRMDDPTSKPTLRPSQGVHIVLDSSFLQSGSAIIIPKTNDGRVLYAIPWYGKVVVGTTDTPVDKIDIEPKALESEINFILNTVGNYLIKPPRREDILSIFTGLRPLAANTGNPASTKEVSRRHKITVSPSGLVSIVGGKWTTYRCMAEETINRAIKAGLIQKRKCITKNLPLIAGQVELSNRLKIYGHGASEIGEIIELDPELGKPIHPGLPYTKAEIIWICRNEMPRTLADMLARRTRALFLDVRASKAMAPEVASLMAYELGYDSKWQEEQIEKYNQLILNYL
jgi:glycerol-3-phosphate dehydrogenase